MGIPDVVPLYACEHCGFTSAAFRPEAVAAHREENPECDGVMRIVFRSDERYRGQTYSLPLVSSSPSPTHEEGSPEEGSHEEGRAVPAADQRGFDLRERLEVDGTLCLGLLGDLDLLAASTLSARLEELKATGRPVRLDLSQLAFIDSSGLQALLVALTDARWIGWRLDVAPEASPSVERAAQMVGIGRVLWPEQRPEARSEGAHAEPPHERA